VREREELIADDLKNIIEDIYTRTACARRKRRATIRKERRKEECALGIRVCSLDFLILLFKSTQTNKEGVCERKEA
jgi:hypothetical protein